MTRNSSNKSSCSPSKRPRLATTSRQREYVNTSTNQSRGGSGTSFMDSWEGPSSSGLQLQEAVNQWEDDIIKLKTLFPTLEKDVLKSYLEIYDIEECIEVVSNLANGYEDGLDDLGILNEASRYHPESDKSLTNSTTSSKKEKTPTSAKPAGEKRKAENAPSYDDILAQIAAVKSGKSMTKPSKVKTSVTSHGNSVNVPSICTTSSNNTTKSTTTTSSSSNPTKPSDSYTVEKTPRKDKGPVRKLPRSSSSSSSSRSNKTGSVPSVVTSRAEQSSGSRPNHDLKTTEAIKSLAAAIQKAISPAKTPSTSQSDSAAPISICWGDLTIPKHKKLKPGETIDLSSTEQAVPTNHATHSVQSQSSAVETAPVHQPTAAISPAGQRSQAMHKVNTVLAQSEKKVIIASPEKQSVSKDVRYKRLQYFTDTGQHSDSTANVSIVPLSSVSKSSSSPVTPKASPSTASSSTVTLKTSSSSTVMPKASHQSSVSIVPLSSVSKSSLSSTVMPKASHESSVSIVPLSSVSKSSSSSTITPKASHQSSAVQGHVGIDIRCGKNRPHSSMKKCNNSTPRREIAKPYTRTSSAPLSAPTSSCTQSSLSPASTPRREIAKPYTRTSSAPLSAPTSSCTQSSSSPASTTVTYSSSLGVIPGQILRKPPISRLSSKPKPTSSTSVTHPSSLSVIPGPFLVQSPISRLSSLPNPTSSASNHLPGTGIQGGSVASARFRQMRTVSQNNQSSFLSSFNQGIQDMNSQLQSMLTTLIDKNNRVSTLCQEYPGTPSSGRHGTPTTPGPGTSSSGMSFPGKSFPGTPFPGTPAAGSTPIPTGTSTPGMPIPGTPTPGMPIPGTPTPGMPIPGTPTPGTSTPGMPIPGTSTPGMPIPGTPTHGTPTPRTPAPGTSTPGMPFPGTTTPTAGSAQATQAPTSNDDEQARQEMLSLQNETEILSKLFPEFDPNYIFSELEKYKDDPSRVTKVNEALLKQKGKSERSRRRSNSWFWIDEKTRKLNPFTDGESNSIEMQYNKRNTANNASIKFSVFSNRMLLFDFRNMTMKDTVTRRTVSIARVDSNSALPGKCSQSGNQNLNEKCLVEVFPATSEFLRVEKRLRDSLPGANVVKIEKVDNNLLQRKYYMHYDLLKLKNGEANVNPKELFHGTRLTKPSEIWNSEAGFDMRYSAQGMWGKGCYFAEHAAYSHNYAHTTQVGNGRKVHQMFLADVLTGDAADLPSDRGIIKPPYNHVTRREYDSVTGITFGHRIYVLYNNAMSYPAYLITYTL